jgi:hypothetical protein
MHLNDLNMVDEAGFGPATFGFGVYNFVDFDFLQFTIFPIKHILFVVFYIFLHNSFTTNNTWIQDKFYQNTSIFCEVFVKLQS